MNTYNSTSPSSVSEISSGINGANAGVNTSTQHLLSKYACKQIQDHFILPILKEKHLQPFHRLVKSIPYRVSRKEITCLRDLEKVILWLAPVSGSYSFWVRRLTHGCSGVKKYCGSSGSSFLDFGEASVQCLHTTVDHLNESDQRRPADRPYTNGYFLDLTEQVRQYAAMINEARERLASGRAGEDNGYTPYVDSALGPEQSILNFSSNERLSLFGGLGRTDRPVELVRMKDGQAISLRSGQPVDPAAYARSASEDEDLQMSMARRKKSEQAAVKQAQRCSECDKEFKRPCDLTKHEKTHSRPWKCNEPSCKYSQYGWPTEKERDRHVNDKHSVTPNMYKCQFRPCPYESKRESNCKQHMEKAHGWAYVRSKNNGKAGKKPIKAGHGKTPPTPQTSTPSSHIFDAGSEFGEPTSPYTQINGYSNTSIGGSTRSSASPFTQNGVLPHANGYASTSVSPYLGTENGYTSFNPNYGWDDSFNRLTPQTSHTPSSHRQSIDSTTNLSTIPSYDMQGDDPTLLDVDWSNMDFTTMNIQLDPITPLSSASSRPIDAYTVQNPSISVDRPKNPNLSPGAQGNEMLYTPYSQDVDEGYSEFTGNGAKPTGDFPLFDDDRPASSMGAANMPLFADLPELPPFQPTTWAGQPYGTTDVQMSEN